MKKIVVDTDIGDDIDDAFALSLASTFRNSELIGTTTVFRNTAQRAQLAQKLFSIIGKEVPVYAGESFPFKEPIHLFKKDSSPFPEKENICQWEENYSVFPVREGGVEFLAECAEKYKDELILVAIGPMTNIATAIKKYPDKMKQIHSIVTMGGWFTNYKTEWNIYCDPEAADIVYSSRIPLYAVGLDVTLQCSLDKEMLEEFRHSEKPVNQLFSLWLSRWFSYFEFEKSVMHDPLAVATLEEDVCKFEKKYVKVNTTNNRGAIEVSKKDKEGFSPIYAATEVDKKRFYDLIRRNLLE